MAGTFGLKSALRAFRPAMVYGWCMNKHDPDLATLTALNADYIASVQNGDVKRFGEILAAEFYCSNPDGALVDRAGFLAQTARPVTITGLRAEDVLIRIMDDVAIIHGATRYTTAEGRAAKGRYTDVWAKVGGRWLCVSAHVTRG